MSQSAGAPSVGRATGCSRTRQPQPDALTAVTLTVVTSTCRLTGPSATTRLRAQRSKLPVGDSTPNRSWDGSNKWTLQ